MRSSDGFIVLIAATAAFGGVVVAASAGVWYASIPFGVVALAMLLVAGWREARATHVLLVAQPRGHPLYRLQEALDERGFGLRQCRGPLRRDCPVLQGRACPFAGRVVAAAVFREIGYTGPAPPCRQGLGVPVLTVLEGSDDPPVLADGEAVAGWETGAAVVEQTVEDLLLGDRAVPVA